MSIGIFDSGVGGLSILRVIHATYPDQDLIYVADSGYAPYGDRAPEAVIERSKTVMRFLLAQNVQAVVVACNTASVLARATLRAMSDIPVIAMEPAIKPAALGSKRRVVGVLATRNTVSNPAVQRLCQLYGQDVKILLQPCPGLADQVERGDLQSTALLERYLRPLLDAGADRIVLGCTHYLFLLPLIEAIVGPDVVVVESSAAIARQLGVKMGLAVPEAGLGPRPVSGLGFAPASGSGAASGLGSGLNLRSAFRPAPSPQGAGSLRAYTSATNLQQAQRLIQTLWASPVALPVHPLPTLSDTGEA
ncbi:MAG: glutamate racemase [Lautropia sp.]|nr:glutamate racemase [Lautropia sp.]